MRAAWIITPDHFSRSGSRRLLTKPPTRPAALTLFGKETDRYYVATVATILHRLRALADTHVEILYYVRNNPGAVFICQK
jgi:hypothetical protein